MSIKNKFEIQLLDHTPKDVLIRTLSMPYNSKELTEKHITKIWDMGHRSFARMGIATFHIKNVSQSLLRQLSRHPHLNLQVKSTRYCDMSNTPYNTPSSTSINEIAKCYDISKHIVESEYQEDIRKIMDIYTKWKERENATGIKELDVAKNFLPLASMTDVIISANYQAWYEFLQLRNCTRAEYEIRQLSLALTKEMKNILPEIFNDLGCRADELGYCNEFKPCDKYPTKEEVINGK